MKKPLVSLGIILLIALAGVLFWQKPKRSLQQTAPTTQISQTSTTDSASNGKQPAIPLQLPQGFRISVFAKGLDRPRDLVFSDAGTLLVSDISTNQVIALPDKDQDGAADEQRIISQGNHPHGLAFYKGKLFVAEVNRVVRYTWDENTLSATQEKVLFSLPENGNHNNRTILFDDRGRMFVSVGSTCNVCVENAQFSATVIVSNEDGDNPRIFSKGLRNAPFLTINPQTRDIWVTEMGRDNLGDNLPPDEINILQEGKDYGWPYCYGNKIHDNQFDAAKRQGCTNTIPPIFEIPAHSAPLGLTFIQSTQFPPDWQGDLLVSYHGSWNRSTPTGYKVVRLHVEGNTITESEDFLTGFISGDTAEGRPVDVIFDKAGNLYVSDDQAGNVYIIQKNPQ